MESLKIKAVRRLSVLLGVMILIITACCYAANFSASVDDNIDAISCHIGNGNLTFSAVANSPVNVLFGGSGRFPDDLFGMPARSGLRTIYPVIYSPPRRSGLRLNEDDGCKWIVSSHIDRTLHWYRFALNFGSQSTKQLHSFSIQSQFPCWPFATVAAMYLAWHLYRRHQQQRRAMIGVCRQCGYDLRATTGRCPECGMVS